ncbi:MAG: thioredoxin domain-containing protein [Vulcanimicrobiaceae bacterium]
MSDFHFSPRANRAHEIEWMSWGDEAFARARREEKAVLLSISAVWCHWCHVMDETSYSDPEIIASINRDFVPVRIDNDERPDINARYNMGGWPTTAFLAADGTTITGATYLAPAQMRRALEEIARFYGEQRDDIAARAAELRSRSRSYEPSSVSDLNAGLVAQVVDEIASDFDVEYGGFGDAPKFPQPEMLELLVAQWRYTGEQRFYAMAARTLREMSRGGMYDHIEGGFFRYSTTRDWSVPHFEKMAEDHGGLLRVLAQLVLWAPTDDMRATLRSALGYVRAVLLDSATCLFAGSQDADEEYFALPLDERKKRSAPFVDRRAYANWNAGLAGAFAWAALALDDDALAAQSAATLDALHERMRDTDGLLYHVLAPGQAPRVRGLLGDQVAYLRALLDAHEATGEARFIERGIAHFHLIIERFEAPDGGFYDHAGIEATLGRLDVPDRPIVENGLVAEAALRLATMTGDARCRTAAERTLTLYARTFAAARSFASAYVRALQRFLAPEVAVKLIGTIDATADFRESARRLPTPFACVRTLAPASASEAGMPALPAPAAYVCIGTLCAAPVESAAGLRAAYDSVAPSETPGFPAP